MSNFNNAIYDNNGKEIGYKCWRCGKIDTQMWGTICNECRDKDEKHKELIEEINKSKNSEANHD